VSEIGIYEAMSTLRAVRQLRPDPIPDDVLQRVLEAVTWAPTGGNAQPFRVIVVKDRDTVASIGELYRDEWGGYASSVRQQLANVPEPVRVQTEKMLRACDYQAEHYAEIPVLLVFCFNPAQMAITDANLDRPSVVGGGSVYPSVQNALLACRAEGLGCVLTTLLCQREAEMCELLEIPEDWGTAAVVPIGYPRLGGHGPIRRRPVEKLAYLDRWEAPLR